jgi:DNA-binding Xre family transcriptional regulator
MGTNGSVTARELYSSLHFHLEEHHLTVVDLAQRIALTGETVDIRTLQRLADPDRPLRQIDTRVLDAVCRALGIEIGALLVFAPAPGPDLQRLPAERQQRLDQLMDAHTEGALSPGELRELEALVAEANDLDFANTQRLVEHREGLRARSRARVHSAAD